MSFELESSDSLSDCCNSMREDWWGTKILVQLNYSIFVPRRKKINKQTCRRVFLKHTRTQNPASAERFQAWEEKIKFEFLRAKYFTRNSFIQSDRVAIRSLNGWLTVIVLSSRVKLLDPRSSYFNKWLASKHVLHQKGQTDTSWTRKWPFSTILLLCMPTRIFLNF